VVLRLDARIDGIGVDPDRPPLRFEAWTGDGWTPCVVDRDTTGGLNRPGDVVLHLPPRHTTSLVGGLRAGWLRARVETAGEGAPAYSSSPTLSSVEAATVGGTVAAVHAQEVPGEELGVSQGVPGQRFSLRRAPVLTGARALRLEVADGSPEDGSGPGDGWQAWTPVPGFADSSATDPHVLVDAASGEVELGPCVRLADGSVRQHGAVPPPGAVLRVGPYLTGGGGHGNVSAGAITVLRSSIPYVSRVENRYPARGGRDAESLDDARSRGAMLVRSRGRAVTAEDFEHIAADAAPGLGRVRCVPVAESPGAVRLLVVPAIGDVGRFPFDALRPAEEELVQVAAALDARRLVGTRVVVEPPRYQGVTVVARLRARPGSDADALREHALGALYRFLSPTVGGVDGRGWPFGRAVQYGEVFAVLQRCPGVDLVEDVRLFPADPVTGVRGEPATSVDVGPDALVFSYDHQVKVGAP
jgi:predicted phage baseplate assembly protein